MAHALRLKMFDNEMNWVTHWKGDLSAARRISGE
jgi:hypothetical protein